MDRERSPPNRRIGRRAAILRGATAIAGTLALAGCTDDVGEELPANEHWPIADLVPDLPVEQRESVIEARIEELSAAEIDDVDSFVAELESRNVEFESVAEVADLLHLEYVETDLERRGTLELAGSVAGAFAALVDAGVEPRGLELVVFETDGTTIGVVEIATEWATAYNEGALSAGAYGEHVAATIESRREPPDPDVAPEE